MAAVTKQIASRAYYAKLDEPDFDLRAWKLRADDYDVVLELTKGVKQPDGKWEWNDKFELTLSDLDIDSLLVLIDKFAAKVKREAWQAGLDNTDQFKIFANPLMTLRGNKYIVSLWCVLTNTTTPDGKTKKGRDIEIRVYDYAGNRDLLNSIYECVGDSKRPAKEYANLTPVYTFKLSSLSRVRGLFVYEDLETLNVLYDAIKLCRLKESAIFVDHFKKVQEELGNASSTQNVSDNVGYNNRIPANSEPASPSITENDTEFPF
jgi:hypothetical protein